MTHLVSKFYLATPFFAVLDFFFTTNIRLAFLQGHTELRILYYCTCFLLAVLAYRNELVTAFFGLIESAVSIGGLAVSVFTPYYQLLDEVSSQATISRVPSSFVGINFFMSAVVLLISFHSNPLLRSSIMGKQD